jgi:hypothetical protein
MVNLGEVQQQLLQLGLALNFPETCYSLYDVHTMRAHMKGKCTDLELPLPQEVFLGMERRAGGRACLGASAATAAVAASADLPTLQQQQQGRQAGHVQQVEGDVTVGLKPLQQQPLLLLTKQEQVQLPSQQQEQQNGCVCRPLSGWPVGGKQEQQQQQKDEWASSRQQVASAHDLHLNEQQEGQERELSGQQLHQQQQQEELRAALDLSVRSSCQQQPEQPQQVQQPGKAVAVAPAEHVGKQAKVEIAAKSFSSSSSSGVGRVGPEVEGAVEEELAADVSPMEVDAAGADTAVKDMRRPPRRLRSLKVLSVVGAHVKIDAEVEPAAAAGPRGGSEDGGGVVRKDVWERVRRCSGRQEMVAGLKRDQDKREAVERVEGAAGGKGEVGVGVGAVGTRGLFPAPHPSRYRRVCWDTGTGRWIAQINVQVRVSGWDA